MREVPQEVSAGASARRARSLVGLGLIPLLVATAGALAADAPDARRGEQVFAVKQCVRCHRPPGERSVGPPLESLRRPQGAWALAGRMWNHAPAMFTVLKVEGLEWPRLDVGEMTDLMAYLKADPTRDPPADRHEGRLILVGKGCLKCHAWRGEGARLGPDLSERRDRYATAPTWAAAMWTHAPSMAAVALERGIVYPRFTGDEMRHLLGFLRGPESAR